MSIGAGPVVVVITVGLVSGTVLSCNCVPKVMPSSRAPMPQARACLGCV